MSDDSNISQLPLELGRNLMELDRDRHEVGECRHVRLNVDRVQRTLACLDCEAKLDALDTLYHIAWWRKHCEDWAVSRQKERAQHEEAIKGLKREAQRLRLKIQRSEQRPERDAAIEKLKAEQLAVLADKIDRAVSKSLGSLSSFCTIYSGDGVQVVETPDADGSRARALIQELTVLDVIASALIGGERFAVFHQKINAAREELDARRRRLSIQIVRPPKKRAKEAARAAGEKP